MVMMFYQLGLPFNLCVLLKFWELSFKTRESGLQVYPMGPLCSPGQSVKV